MSRKTDRLFHCFVCKRDVPRRDIKRSGIRKGGGRWYLCHGCSASYHAARKMEQKEYEASLSDRVLTDTGSIQLGWNGVPSERSLRRRSR